LKTIATNDSQWLIDKTKHKITLARKRKSGVAQTNLNPKPRVQPAFHLKTTPTKTRPNKKK
jgi:hypothetical protein